MLVKPKQMPGYAELTIDTTSCRTCTKPIVGCCTIFHHDFYDNIPAPETNIVIMKNNINPTLIKIAKIEVTKGILPFLKKLRTEKIDSKLGSINNVEATINGKTLFGLGTSRTARK